MTKTLDIAAIYEPVYADLVRVRSTLKGLSEVQTFPLLNEVLDHMVDLGGKQVRPAITLLASRFHPCAPESPILMAAAVELLHIATLVHDDTIDKATLRRGRPTVSNTWGKDVAVLAGDYVFAKSATLVCDTNNVRVIRGFAETIMALSSGELREYVSTFDAEQTREQYWRRIGDKTASLFATAAESGAVLSGAPEKHVQALREFGRTLGMAFQVFDDLLDFEGDEAVVGKPVGSDIMQGVMTLPTILYREQHPQATVTAAFADRENTAKLQQAIAEVRASSALAESRRIAEDLCNQSRQALRDLPDIPAKRSLLALTDYVVQRDR